MTHSVLPQDIVTVAPIFKEKVWGGSRIRAEDNVKLGANQSVGESWNVADLDQESSQITTGHFSGKSIRQVIQDDAVPFLGPAAPSNRFPLLVKLIDAAQDLSIQVHPSSHQETSQHEPKDEAWVIIDSTQNGKILHGFEGNIDRTQFATALERREPEKLLRHAHVKKGDVVHVPPGTIHAICGGVFLLEIQQPSDTTYRIWDYDRPGLDGRPRPLHVEEAMDATHFVPSPPILSSPSVRKSNALYTHEKLLKTPHYLIDRLTLHEATALTVGCSTQGAQVFTITSGECRIVRPNSIDVFSALSSFIVPAYVEGFQVQTNSSCEFIVAGYGDGPLIPSLES